MTFLTVVHCGRCRDCSTADARERGGQVHTHSTRVTAACTGIPDVRSEAGHRDRDRRLSGNFKRAAYVVIDKADWLLDIGFESCFESRLNATRPPDDNVGDVAWPKEVRALAKTYITNMNTREEFRDVTQKMKLVVAYGKEIALRIRTTGRQASLPTRSRRTACIKTCGATATTLHVCTWSSRRRTARCST